MVGDRSSADTPQTISRQKLRELVRSQVQILLEQENLEGAKALLVPVQPVDIAAVIADLPEPMQAIAFRLLAKNEAIEVYEYLEPQVQQLLLEDLRRQDVREIVERMSPDDRARLLDELPAKVVRQLLSQLSPAEREATALLLGYRPGTAGRIMTTEYIALKEQLTVTQALERIRVLAPSAETIYYLYITDAERRLTGILSLRTLVIAQPEQRLGELMTRDVIFVYTDTDQEKVARLIQEYDFLALPVVDRDQRLVGIITVDDVLDVLEAETTEDIYTLGGVQGGDENYFQMNLFKVARKRVVWLFVLLIANSATASVIRSQEAVLDQVVVLAAFIPLLIDTGGNVGAQSSTVVIRGLNTAQLGLGKTLEIIRREAIAGIFLGGMLAIVTVAWALVIQRDVLVALAVGSSLWAIAILAALAGAGLPFLFSYLKLDPALMSAPFITTLVDVLGVLIYLSLARWILGL